MGFLGVFGKSIGKALKNTGIAVGSAAAVAGAAVLQDPELMGTIWAIVPGAPLIVVPLLSLAGQAIIDLIKHSDKM